MGDGMNVMATEIPEVTIIEPKVLGDRSGFFVDTPELSARDAAAPLLADVRALPAYGEV